MEKRKQAMVLVLATAMVAAFFMTGCSKQEEETVREAPGTLSRVVYERTNGSVWGDDFSVNLIPTKIQFAKYHDGVEHDYQYLQNVSITEKQWSKVEEAVLTMVPEVAPVEEPNIIQQFFREYILRDTEVSDGSDDNSLVLIWQTNGGELTEHYAHSSEDSYQNLLDLLTDLVLSES